MNSRLCNCRTGTHIQVTSDLVCSASEVAALMMRELGRFRVLMVFGELAWHLFLVDGQEVRRGFLAIWQRALNPMRRFEGGLGPCCGTSCHSGKGLTFSGSILPGAPKVAVMSGCGSTHVLLSVVQGEGGVYVSVPVFSLAPRARGNWTPGIPLSHMTKQPAETTSRWHCSRGGV